jgi:hypothetical protein
MHKTSYKNNDELILGIKNILSNYRCSFSEDEKVLLNDCINKLEGLNSRDGRVQNAKQAVEVVGILLRIFTVADRIKDLL